jgi:hypothetical protein
MGTLIRMLKLAFILALVVAANFARAQTQDIYVAETVAGSGTGTSCGNAYAVTFWTTLGNWASTYTAGKISPGTTVHVCGTWTGPAGASAYFKWQQAGTSGNPITLRLDNGSAITAPYAGTDGIVDLNVAYAVLSLGSGAVIQTTANGAGLTYQQGGTLIYSANTSNTTVECDASSTCAIGPAYQPLGAQPVSSLSSSGSVVTINLTNPCAYSIGVPISLYGSTNSALNIPTTEGAAGIPIATCTGSTATINTALVASGQTATGGFMYDESAGFIGSGAVGFQNVNNATIQNLNISYTQSGIGYNAVPGDSNTGVTISGNNVGYINHGINIGGSSANATLSNITVNNNHVHDGATFDDGPQVDDSHHDGFQFQANLIATNMLVYNNLCDGNWGRGLNSCYFWENSGGSSGTPLMMFNNVLNDQGSVAHFGCGEICVSNNPPSSTTYLDIFNNTEMSNDYASGVLQSTTCLGIESGTSAVSNIQFINNICERAQFNTRLQARAGQTYNLTSNYNDYYNCYATSATCWNEITFANWQSAGNTYGAQDANATLGNPNLSAGYVPSSGSAVILAGQNLTSNCATIPALCFDTAGNARPASGAWDIGAYQYVAGPSVSFFSGVLSGVIQ